MLISCTCLLMAIGYLCYKSKDDLYGIDAKNSIKEKGEDNDLNDLFI